MCVCVCFEHASMETKIFFQLFAYFISEVICRLLFFFSFRDSVMLNFRD